jgi:Core-2/I-Branching enzyme
MSESPTPSSMNLGFIILAHNQPDSIRRLTDILATDRHQVVIHFDSSATAADREAVARIASEKPGQVRVITRVHCVWGEWSLVEAVLESLREFAKLPEPPDYIHLMSGADFPIRPIAQLKEFLVANPNRDFIECCDIAERAWVKGGLGKERFRFYFPFNFRSNRKAFDRCVRWQRKLKIRRKMPADLRPHMGSQWWTLRWSTCRKVLDFTAAHPEVPKFFKTTWIPDESYFQTLIAKLVPKWQIADLQLMFHHLTPSGRPYVFYNDHLASVKKLPHFFIRKVSPEAQDLWAHLYQDEPLRKKIPSAKLLAKVRDLVRKRIDENHTFTTNVPGYYQDRIQTQVKNEEHATAIKPVVLRSGITRPVVVLLLHDRADLERIAETVSQHPDFRWLGQPYATSGIEIPPGQLERMGLARRSRKTRDLFSRQFTRYLVEAVPWPVIPVMAVFPLEDRPDLETLGGMERMVPVLVTSPELRSHTRSVMHSAVFALSPAVLARAVPVPLDGIGGLLVGLAADDRFRQS